MQLAKSAREVSKFASVALVDIDSEDVQVYVKYFDITLIPSTVFFFNAHHMKMDCRYAFYLFQSLLAIVAVGNLSKLLNFNSKSFLALPCILKFWFCFQSQAIVRLKSRDYLVLKALMSDILGWVWL